MDKSLRYLVTCIVVAFVLVGVTSAYSGGTGTLVDPYVITSCADIVYLSTDSENWNKSFIQTEDITFSGDSPTTQIGNYEFEFVGVYDGQEHSVSNYELVEGIIDGGRVAAFFGVIGQGGDIRNLNLVDVNITGGWNTGGFVGLNNGMITNSNISGKITGSGMSGGFVGDNAVNGVITNCHADVIVISTKQSGGFVGIQEGNIANCSSSGDVSGSEGYAGGFMGYCNDGQVTQNCHASGDVTDDSNYPGGFCSVGAGAFINCYATGDVIGSSSPGGFMGTSWNNGKCTDCYAIGDAISSGNFAGGFGGQLISGEFKNCYATGNATAKFGAGGFAGQSGGTFTNCYAKGTATTTNNHFAGGFSGLTAGTFVNCYATGDASSANMFAGGFAGGPGGISAMTNCFATGSATVTNEHVGGFIGLTEDTTITNCYRVQSAGTDAGTIITEISKFKDYDWLTGNTPNDGLNWSADIISTEADDTKIWIVKSDKSIHPIFQTQDIPLYSGGTGTLVDPYVITSCADIVYLSTDSENWNKSFIQTEDITFSGDSPTTQIGNYEFEFVGVYDGQEHSVSNYELVEGIIDGGRVAAFFGVIGQGGDIRNLNLVDVNITGGWNTGGFVGLNNGMITNSNISGKITGSGMSGGFVGDNAVNGVITNCHADVIVISTKQSGGFVGIQEGNIANCSSSGDVSGSEGYAGGFMGYCNDGQVTQNCHASGDVTDDSNYPGGFCSVGAGAFINCYATGDVIGSSSPGGFMGTSWNNGKCTDCYAIGDAISSGNFAGGFGGQLISGEFKNCYATGNATAKFGAGGFAGQSGGTFTNCYAKGTATTTNNHFAGGFSGLTAGTFVNCYATGDASSANMFAGGFAGGPGGISAMTNCFATGSATVTNEHVGGFIGLTEDTTITNCYRVQSAGTDAGTIITEISKFKDYDWLTGNTPNDGLNWSADIISTEADDTKIWIVKSDKSIHPIFQTQDIPLYSGGAGTEASPYQIKTEADLNTLAATSGDWAYHFVVMDDIAFTAASTDTIGTETTKFTGTFNGNRKTISNFTIDKSDSGYIGLFGYVGAGGEIKDIVVEAGVAGVKGDSRVGILVGGNKGVITSCSATGDVTAENENAGGLVGQNYKTGIITDCSATGDTTTSYNAGGLIGDNSGKVTNCNAIGNANANSYTGGIAGSNGGGTITKCTAKGDVYSYEYGGGLVGSNNGNITDCSATGDVHGHSSQGGLVGFSESGNIINCSASGDVNGDYCDGGLVGINSYDNSITNCFATGNVTVEGYGGGGLIGQSYGTIANCYATGNTSITGYCAGGLVGDSVGTITNCYATGIATGGGAIGGLVGDNNGDITNCYRVQSTGTSDGTLITDLSKFKDIDWLTGTTTNDGLAWPVDIISNVKDDTKIWRVTSSKSTYPIFQWITVPLVVDFTASAKSIFEGDDIVFTDLSVYDPISWSWSFGDGGVSTLQNPTHTYTTAGNYAVSLTASNPAGNDTETKTAYITVSVLKQTVADFKSDIQNAQKNALVTFTDLSTGDPATWSWNFGDNTTSTLQNPTHTYQTTGTYGVKLTIHNGYNGDTKTKSGYITVYDAISAGFSANATTIYETDTVAFTDLSTGTPTTWSWSFGDGGVSTLQNPTHTYVTAGNYAVSLMASNPACNDTETKTAYITVVTKYGGGAGTLETPYQIRTEADLNTLAATSADWTSHFIVMNDIAFTAASTQTIGTTTTKFTGTFNGNRKTISNFTIDKSDSGYIGLFGYVGAGGEIKDIVVEAGVAGVKGDSRVGILVGGNKGVITSCSATGDVTAENENAGGLVGQNYKTGIITDCSATGDTTTSYNAGGLIGDNSGKVTNCNAIGNANANSYTGGIAGSNGGGTITKCTAKGDVYSYEYGGGLVGSNNGNITDCSATGDVHGHSSQGGLVGFSESGNIINCSASGDVNGDYCDGGLVGINSYDNSITNCFATGNVTVEGYGGGGLIGQSYGTIANCYATGNTSITGYYAGGLVGDSVGTITNCYATGNVHAGGSFAGGLVGGAYASVTNCYATGDAHAEGDYVGGLVGDNNGDITNCYATGNATAGAGGAGGLVDDNSGTITNCYRVQSTGTSDGTLITDLSKFKDIDWLTGTTTNDGLAWPVDIISNVKDDTKIWRVTSFKSAHPIFQWITVPPVVDFKASATSIFEGDDITFTDLSIYDLTSWSWSFGDSGVSTLQNPTHTYTTAGNYAVTLTASNPAGNDTETKTAYINVSVQKQAVADFKSDIQNAQKNALVSFTDLSTGDPVTWAWSFGDTATSALQNPTHAYATTGTYEVKLTIHNGYNGDTKTKSGYITVYDVISAGFSANATTIYETDTVAFTDLSTGTPTSWSWSFGDSGVSTLQNPTHTYTTAGNYAVTLTASNPAGNDTETKTAYINVSVQKQAVADFKSDIQNAQKNALVSFTDLSTGDPVTWAWSFGDTATSALQNPTHAYATTGTYEVKLTIHNGYNGDTKTKSGYITVYDVISAGFSANATTIYETDTVAFTDLSTGTPTSWSWSFGDSGVSTLQNPTHTYTTAGNYAVTLTASNPAGNDTETKTAYINVSVQKQAVADFKSDIQNAQKNALVSFTDLSTGDPVTWAWSFGDTATSALQNPTHAYATTGTYEVKLTIHNGYNGDTKTKSGYITVYDVISAGFSANATTIYETDTVAFTDLSTGTPTSWSWSFGDSGVSTLQNPTHTYTTAGNYAVTLTASNPAGNDTETKTAYINVSVQKQAVADFKSDIQNAQKNALVSFTDLSTGDPVTWAWSFGDTATSALQNPTHAYATTGTYEVKLTIHNGYNGDTKTKSGYITVYDVISAGFSANATTIYETDTVAFTDLSTGTPTSWSWSFGDSGVSTLQNPTHIYTTAGNYAVTLTASNPAGNDTETKTAYINVSVQKQAVADFKSDIQNAQKNALVSFTDLSTGDPVTWAWSFGDTATSALQNPTHAYATTGTYEVKLTIHNGYNGDTKTKSGYITVYDVISAGFSANATTIYETDTVAFTDLSTGTPTSWSWSFGDSGVSTLQNPTHTYTTAGNYAVTLTASNPAGNDTETKTAYINVSVQKQAVADFKSDIQNAQKNALVSFTDLSTGDPVTWAWSFGDTATSALQNPTHAYATTGTYEVKLTIHNGYNGDTKTKSGYITVYDQLIANFTANMASGELPLTVQFTDTSLVGSGGDVIFWRWDLGNGYTSSLESPITVYPNAGVYSVSLSVTDEAGMTSETIKTNYIHVTEVGNIAPPVSFSASPVVGAEPLFVTFRGTAGGNSVGWNWEFGDGSTSTEQNPTITYVARSAPYTVSLTVLFDGGLENSITKYDYISVYNASTGPESTVISSETGESWIRWSWSDYAPEYAIEIDEHIVEREHPSNEYSMRGCASNERHTIRILPSSELAAIDTFDQFNGTDKLGVMQKSTATTKASTPIFLVIFGLELLIFGAIIWVVSVYRSESLYIAALLYCVGLLIGLYLVMYTSANPLLPYLGIGVMVLMTVVMGIGSYERVREVLDWI